MRSRKGISPVIATVIIVAVAIAISIAVAGWLMGLWGTFGTTEQLTIMPDTSLKAGTSTSTLTLHVKNTGSKAAVIIKVELVGVNATSTTVTLSQGQDTVLTVPIPGSTVAGTQYLVKVYTASGNVYQGYVVASS